METSALAGKLFVSFPSWGMEEPFLPSWPLSTFIYCVKAPGPLVDISPPQGRRLTSSTSSRQLTTYTCGPALSLTCQKVLNLLAQGVSPDDF